MSSRSVFLSGQFGINKPRLLQTSLVKLWMDYTVNNVKINTPLF